MVSALHSSPAARPSSHVLFCLLIGNNVLGGVQPILVVLVVVVIVVVIGKVVKRFPPGLLVGTVVVVSALVDVVEVVFVVVCRHSLQLQQTDHLHILRQSAFPDSKDSVQLLQHASAGFVVGAIVVVSGGMGVGEGVGLAVGAIVGEAVGLGVGHGVVVVVKVFGGGVGGGGG